MNFIGLYDSPSSKILQFAPHEKVGVLQASSEIDTTYERGESLVRLVLDAEKKDAWRAFNLFTSLKSWRITKRGQIIEDPQDITVPQIALISIGKIS